MFGERERQHAAATVLPVGRLVESSWEPLRRPSYHRPGIGYIQT